jgi:hypothetical protein
MQGQLPAAAALYEQALQLRRGLLAATQEEQQAQAGSAAATVDVASGEATCSATLDLAASCIKLAGARRELAANAEAQVRRCIAGRKAVAGNLQFIARKCEVM